MLRSFVLLVAADRSGALLCCVASPWCLPDTCGLNGASLSSGSSIPLQISLLIKQSSRAFFSGPENCFMLRRSPTLCFSLTSSLSLCSDLFWVCVRYRVRFLSLCALSLSLSLSPSLPPSLPSLLSAFCLCPYLSFVLLRL